MLDDSTLKLSLLTGGLIVVSLFVSRYFRRDPMLDAIPTVGFSDPILSYFTAIQFNFHGVRMLNEGYEKTTPGLFKIANFWRWMVLASGPGLIEDMRKAPDDVLCALEPRIEVLQRQYTLHVLNPKDTYNSNVVRSKLTRDIPAIFKEVRDELVVAMDDLIQIRDDKWVKVPIQATLQRVICRTSNRVFVGLPLCRDHEYQKLNQDIAVNVVKFAMILRLFPKPLKLIVSRMLSNLPSRIRQEIEFIRPLVEERFAKMEEYGDDWDKPNDLLMWFMSEAKGVERSLEGLARRLLMTNFAAIHTTSTTLTQILYRLLANPEYMEPLRQEVDAAIAEEGWTKAGLDKMHKIDSFIRETQRLDGISIFSMIRLVLRPFTFSNGVTVPAGTFLCVPASAANRDEKTYSNPNEFDGFRFAKLRESEWDNVKSRYLTVSPSSDNLAFGLGRHTCPGRFFAVNEAKAVLAHIVATYDIKLEDGKGAPRQYWFSGTLFTRPGNVMFRARQK